METPMCACTHDASGRAKETALSCRPVNPGQREVDFIPASMLQLKLLGITEVVYSLEFACNNTLVFQTLDEV